MLNNLEIEINKIAKKLDDLREKENTLNKNIIKLQPTYDSFKEFYSFFLLHLQS